MQSGNRKVLFNCSLTCDFCFRDELDIDVRDIYYKVRCVMLPLPYFRLKLQLVRESPDFWGPLFIVLAYALLSLYGQFKVILLLLCRCFRYFAKIAD